MWGIPGKNGRKSQSPGLDQTLSWAYFLLFQNRGGKSVLDLAGVEINFLRYLQKIVSAMISNMLNASCYSQNEKYDFLLYYCQYH